MEQPYKIRPETKWLLVQSMLLWAASPRAGFTNCPATCSCINDTATCAFGNSTANITFSTRTRMLQINCTDSVDDFQYDCGDWPRFNVSNVNCWLEVSGCAPSVSSCASHMLSPVSHVTTIKVKDIAGTYTPNDLANLDRVKVAQMNLKDEDAASAEVVVNSLPALIDFVVTGGRVNISSNVFKLSKLEHLYLERNSIRSLPPNTFIGLPNLTSLNIQQNDFEHLDNDTFRGLKAVTTIVLHNNTLTTIDAGAFCSMKQLHYINIDGNRLNIIPNGLLTCLDKLSQIYIRNNKVEMTLDSHAFANLPPSIKAMDISNNKLQYLPDHVFDGSANVEILSFANNNIENIPDKIFSNITSLLRINLSGNRIKEVSDELFSDKNSLIHIDLSYNNISTLNRNVFKRCRELKEINLSDNKLSDIDWDVFNETNLRTLTLASNKLQQIVINSSVEWQTGLLNLSHNELNEFEEFVEITGVQHFDLSGNKITLIKQSQIYRLNRNVTIDLRNNTIAEVVWDTGDLSVNFTPGAISLYLSNNPLQCDCIVTTLLKEWHKYGILADYEHITCDNEDKLSNLDVYVQCNKKHALVALIGSSAVGALVLAVILLTIFTQRKKIWANIINFFISYEFCRHRMNSRGILKKKGDASFEMKEGVQPFDLFISCAQQDNDFVIREVLPILKNDLELKVCVNDKDWIVGDLVLVQIKESIQSSTMTMIILTEHYLKSELPILQFHTMNELLTQDEKSRVILVLINESIATHDKLDGVLKAYIDMNTYLVWDDNFFWEKLQKIFTMYWNNKFRIK